MSVSTGFRRDPKHASAWKLGLTEKPIRGALHSLNRWSFEIRADRVNGAWRSSRRVESPTRTRRSAIAHRRVEVRSGLRVATAAAHKG